MSLSTLEKGFRALSRSLREEADDASRAGTDPHNVVTQVLVRLSDAMNEAANDLDDQIRKQYGVKPRGEDNGDT